MCIPDYEYFNIIRRKNNYSIHNLWLIQRLVHGSDQQERCNTLFVIGMDWSLRCFSAFLMTTSDVKRYKRSGYMNLVAIKPSGSLMCPCEAPKHGTVKPLFKVSSEFCGMSSDEAASTIFLAPWYWASRRQGKPCSTYIHGGNFCYQKQLDERSYVYTKNEKDWENYWLLAKYQSQICLNSTRNKYCQTQKCEMHKIVHNAR